MTSREIPGGPGTVVRRAVGSGTVAILASTAALAMVARSEGKSGAQPLNATSHWLYGPDAARIRRAGVDPTIIGFATHCAATLFWAGIFEASLAMRPVAGGRAAVRRGAEIGLLAALVDYRLTPRRFTPGWELVLSRRGMAAAYAAMAAGLAGTAAMRRRSS